MRNPLPDSRIEYDAMTEQIEADGRLLQLLRL
jgi:hypothetical protein